MSFRGATRAERTIRPPQADPAHASAPLAFFAVRRRRKRNRIVRASTLALAVVALLISFAVEFSQLYHAEWIDAIRRTTLGSIALGSTFFWRDLIAYTIGVGFAALMDYAIRRSSLK